MQQGLKQRTERPGLELLQLLIHAGHGLLPGIGILPVGRPVALRLLGSQRVCFLLLVQVGLHCGGDQGLLALHLDVVPHRACHPHEEEGQQRGSQAECHVVDLGFTLFYTAFGGLGPGCS